jgi:type I restriction enzyme S subunit
MRETTQTISNYFSDLDVSLKSSFDALKGDFRLDSGYYTNLDSIIHTVETKPLSAFCERIFMGPIFKRDEVKDEKYGTRFLASNEIVSYEKSDNYITKEQALKHNLVVSKGMILVTGYGTIGSIRIVDDIIQGCAIADNVTRIIPKQHLGFIACFLSSSIGNKLLNDYASGSAVRFIQAPQIGKIPVPVIGNNTFELINHNFLRAVSCREQSHELLQKANTLVLRYNNLPPLSSIKPETLDADVEVEIRMTGLDEFTQDYRLDAHFYNPMAKFVIDQISQKKYETLKNLSNEIIMGKRFKRNYVETEHGTPFLSGKNIIQIRPETNFLSNTEISFIDDLLVKQNWTLITCSGTLGRVCFVYKNYEEFAASQHILRVNPNENLIDPAYLNCFLSSDYGYHQLLRYRYGSVIDEIDDKNIESVLVPLPSKEQQKEIGDLVRQAYELRAEAIKLEDEAQDLLTQALTQA